METNQLFSMALGLGNAWKVVKSEMNIERRELKLWLDFERGVQFVCSECGEFCPVHDTVEKKWRHLDFWQHQTELIARVPRVCCEEHGVRQAKMPWARPGSGFTLEPVSTVCGTDGRKESATKRRGMKTQKALHAPNSMAMIRVRPKNTTTNFANPRLPTCPSSSLTLHLRTTGIPNPTRAA